MTFTVEIELEDDGQWIAEVLELPGALAYGHTPEAAQAKVQALALRVIADADQVMAGYDGVPHRPRILEKSPDILLPAAIAARYDRRRSARGLEHSRVGGRSS